MNSALLGSEVKSNRGREEPRIGGLGVVRGYRGPLLRHLPLPIPAEKAPVLEVGEDAPRENLRDSLRACDIILAFCVLDSVPH